MTARLLFCFLLSAAAGCEKESGVSPETLAAVPVLDFEYRRGSYPGIVRFLNLSKGMTAFHWDFGFADASGTPATSQERSPVFTFPANGTYYVQLSGMDSQGGFHSQTKSVKVTTHP